jgi:hypothetical protein
VVSDSSTGDPHTDVAKGGTAVFISAGEQIISRVQRAKNSLKLYHQLLALGRVHNLVKTLLLQQNDY